jgi:hypothetical protein
VGFKILLPQKKARYVKPNSRRKDKRQKMIEAFLLSLPIIISSSIPPL